MVLLSLSPLTGFVVLLALWLNHRDRKYGRRKFGTGEHS
jgi:hypothetical protein